MEILSSNSSLSFSEFRFLYVFSRCEDIKNDRSPHLEINILKFKVQVSTYTQNKKDLI